MNIKYLIVGIGLIPFGVYIIYRTFKSPVPIKEDITALNIRGVVSGIMGIILGIALIIHAFK